MDSKPEFVDQFIKGEKNRTIEYTIMNKNFSLLHAILFAEIEAKLDKLRKENEEKVKAERIMTNSY